MILPLQVVLLLLITGSIFFYLACTFCVAWFRATSQQSSSPSNQTPVSLLIPVCGLDAGAFENWSSLCQQGYDNYEVLFGVMNPQDPAVPVLERVVNQFNHAQLHICHEVRGVNHQISNLSHLLEKAKNEIVIFADSDIRVTPDYLKTVTVPLQNPSVGAVTCAYFDHAPKHLGAALASFGRCVDFIPSVLVARRLDGTLKFAIGPTIATRQSVLEKIDGLKNVCDRIGSDYHIGNMIANAGYRVELSNYILENDCETETFSSVFKRELRWARTIRINRGSQYYGMVFCYGTIYSLLLLLLSSFQPWAIAVCILTFAVRLMQVALSIWNLNSPKLLRWLWIVPIRDLMSFAVWIGGCFGRRVYWRGRFLDIGVKGRLSES